MLYKIKKTPRSNMGKNLDDLKFNDDILDTTSKAWSMKDTTDNLYLKIREVWSGRDFQGGEDMILWYRQEKYLQKIYMIKDFYQNINRSPKTLLWKNNSIQKWAKRSEQTLHQKKKKVVQMANTLRKRCSISYVISELQIKTN